MSIFVDEDTKEGLYAVGYGRFGDEFHRLFNLWNDVEYVRKYLLLNKEYLKSGYFEDMYLDEVETEIANEAEEIEKLLREYSEEGFSKNGRNLQMLFHSLSKTSKVTPPPLEKTKASIKDRVNFPKNILRIYAIRIDKNTFVITGGAIKLVQEMSNHPDTKNELEKLDQVRAWLKSKGYNTTEDLIFGYE